MHISEAAKPVRSFLLKILLPDNRVLTIFKKCCIEVPFPKYYLISSKTKYLRL